MSGGRQEIEQGGGGSGSDTDDDSTDNPPVDEIQDRGDSDQSGNDQSSQQRPDDDRPDQREPESRQRDGDSAGSDPQESGGDRSSQSDQSQDAQRGPVDVQEPIDASPDPDPRADNLPFSEAPSATDPSREVARERAAEEFGERLGDDIDSSQVEIRDGFAILNADVGRPVLPAETTLATSQRDSARQQLQTAESESGLRSAAADLFDARNPFVDVEESDVELQQTDEGLRPTLDDELRREGQVRELDAQNPFDVSREDVSFGDDGARIREDVLQDVRESRALESFVESSEFTREDVAGIEETDDGFRPVLTDEARREQAADAVAAAVDELDSEDVSPEDIVGFEETENGDRPELSEELQEEIRVQQAADQTDLDVDEIEAVESEPFDVASGVEEFGDASGLDIPEQTIEIEPVDSVQRSQAIEEFVETSRFGRDDISTVRQAEDGFEPVLTDDARQQQLQERFASQSDLSRDDIEQVTVTEPVQAGVEEFARTEGIDPTVQIATPEITAAAERERAVDAITSETDLAEEDIVAVQRTSGGIQPVLSEEAREERLIDAITTDSDLTRDDIEEIEFNETPTGVQEFAEQTGQDLPSEIARPEFTAEATRELVREQIADERDINPDEIAGLIRTEDGFRAFEEEDAFRTALRERVAEQQGGDPEDVELIEVDGRLRGVNPTAAGDPNPNIQTDLSGTVAPKALPEGDGPLDTIQEASRTAANTTQERIIDPLGGSIGVALEQARPSTFVAPRETVENPEFDSLTEPQTGAGQQVAEFSRGVGSVAPLILQSPDLAIRLGRASAIAADESFEAGRDDGALEGVRTAGEIAGGAAVGVAEQFGRAVTDRTAFTAGTLVGTGGAIRLASGAGRVTGATTRFAIQPGAEITTGLAQRTIGRTARGQRALQRIPGDRLAPEEIALGTASRVGRAAGRSAQRLRGLDVSIRRRGSFLGSERAMAGGQRTIQIEVERTRTRSRDDAIQEAISETPPPEAFESTEEFLAAREARAARAELQQEAPAELDEVFPTAETRQEAIEQRAAERVLEQRTPEESTLEEVMPDTETLVQERQRMRQRLFGTQAEAMARQTASATATVSGETTASSVFAADTGQQQLLASAGVLGRGQEATTAGQVIDPDSSQADVDEALDTPGEMEEASDLLALDQDQEVVESLDTPANLDTVTDFAGVDVSQEQSVESAISAGTTVTAGTQLDPQRQTAQSLGTRSGQAVEQTVDQGLGVTQDTQTLRGRQRSQIVTSRPRRTQLLDASPPNDDEEELFPGPRIDEDAEAWETPIEEAEDIIEEEFGDEFSGGDA